MRCRRDAAARTTSLRRVSGNNGTNGRCLVGTAEKQLRLPPQPPDTRRPRSLSTSDTAPRTDCRIRVGEQHGNTRTTAKNHNRRFDITESLHRTSFAMSAGSRISPEASAKDNAAVGWRRRQRRAMTCSERVPSTDEIISLRRRNTKLCQSRTMQSFNIKTVATSGLSRKTFAQFTATNCLTFRRKLFANVTTELL